METFQVRKPSNDLVSFEKIEFGGMGGCQPVVFHESTVYVGISKINNSKGIILSKQMKMCNQYIKTCSAAASRNVRLSIDF